MPESSQHQANQLRAARLMNSTATEDMESHGICAGWRLAPGQRAPMFAEVGHPVLAAASAVLKTAVEAPSSLPIVLVPAAQDHFKAEPLSFPS